MLPETSVQTIFNHFCDYPTEEVHLRELSRRVRLTMPAIVRGVKILEKEGLVTVRRTKAWTMVKANREEKFRRLKRVHNLERVYASGLVDEIKQAYRWPHAIILFGSYSRGEDTEQSDIDIAIIAGTPGTITKKYKEALRREVSLHHITMSRASPEFQTELANGVVLEGAL